MLVWILKMADGMHTLLDLRFADDIFFAKTFEEPIFLLDELVTCLAERGYI